MVCAGMDRGTEEKKIISDKGRAAHIIACLLPM